VNEVPQERNAPAVLLVDDEPSLVNSASMVLRTSGVHEVLTLDDSRKVLPLLQAKDVSVLVVDLNMPFMTGQQVLEEVSANHPDLPVIVMTATNELETAVDCMRAGAVDYLVKPVERNRLVSAVKRALEMRSLKAEVLSLKDRLLSAPPLRRPEVFADIVTTYGGMHAIFHYLEAIALSPHAVLVAGESGTGKELIAQALHRLSLRKGQLVAVNVAGLDDQMFSDTLFGHVRGSFTGAERAREGLVASAADGTLFLDEIGDLTTASQVKLLRLLQDNSYYPLGADQARQSRARVVVATNVDVLDAVAKGTFRKDLYYRLRTHQLRLPPLRERKGDLHVLVETFVAKSAAAMGKPTPAVPPALYSLLGSFPFPGNVRELESLVLDAVARHRDGPMLSLQSFREALRLSSDAPFAEAGHPEATTVARDAWGGAELLPTLQQAEDSLITEALRRSDGNQGVAARLLGISRQALNKRLSRQRHAADEHPCDEGCGPTPLHV
jgi:two-component system nitrogen regulation response regulator GlnG